MSSYNVSMKAIYSLYGHDMTALLVAGLSTPMYFSVNLTKRAS